KAQMELRFRNGPHHLGQAARRTGLLRVAVDEEDPIEEPVVVALIANEHLFVAQAIRARELIALREVVQLLQQGVGRRAHAVALVVAQRNRRILQENRWSDEKKENRRRLAAKPKEMPQERRRIENHAGAGSAARAGGEEDLQRLRRGAPPFPQAAESLL